MLDNAHLILEGVRAGDLDLDFGLELDWLYGFRMVGLGGFRVGVRTEDGLGDSLLADCSVSAAEVIASRGRFLLLCSAVAVHVSLLLFPEDTGWEEIVLSSECSVVVVVVGSVVFLLLFLACKDVPVLSEELVLTGVPTISGTLVQDEIQ